MTTRTSAEIEAGAKEYVWPSRLFSAEEQDALWLKISESDRRHYLDRFRDVLSAADAAAAPAVGVSKGNAGVLVSSLIDAVEDKRHNDVRDIAQRIIALLTAPEPGTDGGAG